MMTIKIKYFTDKVQKLEKISKGNWIDLRASEEVEMKQGEFRLIPLGIAVELPRGYEAHVVPRSSTFKNFGLIQVNHQGVIDGPDRETGEGGYCGNDDQWFVPMYAMRDTVIHLNDRICQFRIMEQQPELVFEEVSELTGANRGGFGSTGKN
jgi:dUTP pyrophosphatase